MNEVKTYYLMSQGLGNKMYTLWRVTEGKTYIQKFIQNLSINKEEAFIKAENLAKGFELIDEANDSLRKIIRQDSGLINFGKHYGKSLTEVPDSYISWLAEGGQITITGELGGEYVKNLASDPLKKLALEEAIKRELFVEFEGKFINKRLRDYIINEGLGYGHHFEDKAKPELEVEMIGFKSFDTSYGTIWIYIFKDINTGNKYQYKGGNLINLLVTEEQKSYGANYGESLKKGDRILLKGTVKLGVYNGREITYLQRVKVLKNLEPNKSLEKTLKS